MVPRLPIPDGYAQLFDDHYAIALCRNGDGRDEATMAHAVSSFCRGVHIYGTCGVVLTTGAAWIKKLRRGMPEYIEQLWWNRQH